MIIQRLSRETLSLNCFFNCLKFSTVLILLQLLQFQSLQAQTSSKSKKISFPPNEEADAIVDRYKNVYGGQVAVYAIKDSQLLYQKETGEFNVNTQEEIGALSSWFTAALVMQFVDQGKIKLDDKVSKYLPIFNKYSKGYITIRHCLMHTTGIEADKGGVQKFFQKTKFASLEEQVDAFASKHEIKNNPGQEFYYSNIGLNIAARVLEVVGKKTFDRLVTERIFRPLGMKRTSFASEVAADPTSGARSSATDYVRFLNMLLNKGTLNGKTVLSPKAVDQLLSMQPLELPKVYVPAAASQLDLAFGSWAVANGGGQPKTFVSPGFFGSYAYLDLDRKIACAVITKPTSKEDKGQVFEVVEALK